MRGESTVRKKIWKILTAVILSVILFAAVPIGAAAGQTQNS